MSDGRIHGVHVWSGPSTDEPPERPVPGPLKWDMTRGVATDTPESLANTGRKVELRGPEDARSQSVWPAGDLKPNEGRALAAAIRSEPGHTVCDTWDGTDWQGNHIRVSFVARNGLEPGVDGREHLIARGMNWRAEPADEATPSDRLAEQILHGLAQPGVHRALFDPHSWTLLKWLDAPCPFYDWRRITADDPRIHPDDEPKMAAMTHRVRRRSRQRSAADAGPRRRLGAGARDRQPGANRRADVRRPGFAAAADRLGARGGRSGRLGRAGARGSPGSAESTAGACPPARSARHPGSSTSQPAVSARIARATAWACVHAAATPAGTRAAPASAARSAAACARCRATTAAPR